MSINSMSRNGIGAAGISGGVATAISGYSTDRRPVKMKDYGLLKGGA